MQQHSTPAEVSIGFGKTVAWPIAETVERVTEALKGEGFGVLTTIDVQATLKAKLSVESEPYLILGACNPHLAHQALSIEPDAGLLLPCNVVVRAAPPSADGAVQTRVDIADPLAMLGVMRNDAMGDLAENAHARLQRALAAL